MEGGGVLRFFVRPLCQAVWGAWAPPAPCRAAGGVRSRLLRHSPLVAHLRFLPYREAQPAR